MDVITAAQMREIDKYAIEVLGIPGITLMENAGREFFYALQDEVGVLFDKKCAVVCGKGNNGGDGFVVARYLLEKGAKVTVLLVDGDILTPDADYYFKKLNNINIINIDNNKEKAVNVLSEANIIIDAIYGTGFKGDVKENIAEVINIINNSKAFKASIDIPSALQCDTGTAKSVCVKANLTVTFCLPKPCHFIYPGKLFSGKVIIADIGIPQKAVNSQNIYIKTIDENLVDSILKPRDRDTHKSTYGRLLSVCGSRGMSGAAYLSAMGALRCGAGLVTVASPDCISDILAAKLNETLFLPLEDNGITLNIKCKVKLLDSISKSSAALIGCGIGINSDTAELVKSVVEYSEVPLVIDADGITALNENINVLYNKKADIVLTPHPGEMARLLDISPKEVQEDRITAAKSFSQKYNVIVVLKGASSIIASPDGKILINLNGNPGLAKGGSGDVLAGMLASFLAQGINSLNAAICAVYLHGKAADICAQKISEYGMLPGDLLNEIPLLLNKYNGV